MRSLLFTALLLSCACSAPLPTPDAGHWWDEGALAACARLGGAMPATIDDVVTRLNALPQPRSVACFAASLPRPLSLVATTSTQSAQPAAGARSPRIFVLTPTLIFSVVPDGDGAPLLELGELVSDVDSLKGELHLPPDGGLSPAAPYDGLIYSASTTRCGLCHRSERPSSTVEGGFVSAAFRPDDDKLVSLDALRTELDACDPAAEPARCDILAGLFGFGEVRQGKFPTVMERFTAP